MPMLTGSLENFTNSERMKTLKTDCLLKFKNAKKSISLDSRFVDFTEFRATLRCLQNIPRTATLLDSVIHSLANIVRACTLQPTACSFVCYFKQHHSTSSPSELFGPANGLSLSPWHFRLVLIIGSRRHTRLRGTYNHAAAGGV